MARSPEDVLFRRLRLGQMNEARTNALLPKIAAAFAGTEAECACECAECCECEEGKCECTEAKAECTEAKCECAEAPAAEAAEAQK